MIVGFLLLASATAHLPAQDTSDARIQRVLGGLRPRVAIKGRPVVQWTLAERMKALHVPAVSIAIMDGGQIVWAGAFGVREGGTADSVTTTTLFQAQSISKPVAVTATLGLVDAGRLSLDTNVNAYLKSWKVPENRFTTSEKVTLRRIASHSAGLTVGGMAGYKLGDSLPTLIQILDGVKPANNPPIRVDTFPGAIERYSGGGMLVMQQLLIDVTGEPFPALMKRLVFDRIGMRSSTYEQPLPIARRAQAVSGHDLEGAMIAGKWPVLPEMAAAGLWTTPTDLARWTLEIAAAWNGTSNGLLSRRLATDMLTVQKGDAGLGVFLEGSGSSFGFGHAGSVPGFRAELVMFPATGKGAVVMTNADQGGQLITELFLSMAAEYQWPRRGQREREVVSLTPSDLDGLVGAYDAPPLPSGAPAVIEVTRDGDRLFFEFRPFNSRSELYPESRDAFFTMSGITARFSRDSSGRALTVNLAGQVTGKRRQ